ncbi:MAG: hypothetical protein AAF690_15855 [Acidobacteriota bacterium]
MKRWLLPAALLLSLGFNFGLLASYVMDRFEPVPVFEKRRTEPPSEPASATAGEAGTLRPTETDPPTTVASPEAEAAEPLVLVPEPAPAATSEPEPEPTPQRESARSEPSSTQPSAARQEQEADESAEGAQPARPGFGAARRLGQRTDFEQMADRLELFGEQREKFLADHLEFSSKVRRIVPRTLRLRRAFFSELSAAQPDVEKIKQLTQQLGAANVALERALADVVLKTRAHLDVDQQQQYLRYVQTRMQRLQEFVQQRGSQRPRQGQGQRIRRRPNARPPGF